MDVRFSAEADVGDIVAAGYDLVVAADGANSRFRERYRDVFGPGAETATAKFIWLGTTYPFEGLTFVHERGPHGVFAVHGYPIGNGVSTFIVETDEPSWTAAGLDEFDVTQPPGLSDEKSRAYLQQLFAGQIDGHPLLVNNSRWGNFRTRRARRWRHRAGGTAIALLGDAAHTAHFSVGSGTKMAMEDAIALAAAVTASPGDLDAALAEYELMRRPQVAKIQDSARPSLSWWEHFGRSHDTLPGWQFAYHFFTRSLTDGKLRRRDPDFVESAHARWKAALGAAPLDSALPCPATRCPVTPCPAAWSRSSPTRSAWARTGCRCTRGRPGPGRPTAEAGRWRSPPRRPRRTSCPRSRPSPAAPGPGRPWSRSARARR